jgi:hypothetical protein
MQDAHGHIRFGRYQGRIAQLDWHAACALALAAHAAALRHKRWQYLALDPSDYVIGLAVVDVGWTGAAFAYLFDRRAGRLLADVRPTAFRAMPPAWPTRLLPMPLFQPRLTIRFSRRDGYLAVDLSTPRYGWPPMSPSTTCRRYWPPLHPATGWHIPPTNPAHCGQRFCRLPGPALLAGWSHGQPGLQQWLAGAETAWRWASAHRAGLGFNLQQGYMADAENAIWLNSNCLRWKVYSLTTTAAALASLAYHDDDGCWTCNSPRKACAGKIRTF